MSAWKDLVTASLVGIGSESVSAGLPADLEATLIPADALPTEARFLTRAGALAWWRRAGYQPERADAPPPDPSAADPGQPLSPMAESHLRLMLGGQNADLLSEWLGEAARLGRRLPPECLPALLNRARTQRAERPLVQAAGGARVRWLAGLNPDWNFAASDDPAQWETGGREQRLAILRGWRVSNPAEARTRLEAVWDDEAADARAAFLAVLENGLCTDDEPFLERSLDDRSKEVRALAANFLSRLPGSALCVRMTARATPLLAFKKSGLLSRATLEITLPDTPDAPAQRDGLDPKPSGLYRSFGAKASVLAQMLAAVPLPHWQQTLQQEPAALLKAAEKSEFARAVGCGWALAALRQRDVVWAQALLDAPSAVQPPADAVGPGKLSCLLPEAARTARLKDSIRRHGLNHRESWPETEALLLSFRGYLPVPLAQDILREWRLAAGVDLPWHLRYFQSQLATKIPPKLLPFALDGWPENNPCADFVALLSFRRDALAALAQS